MIHFLKLFCNRLFRKFMHNLGVFICDATTKLLFLDCLAIMIDCVGYWFFSVRFDLVSYFGYYYGWVGMSYLVTDWLDWLLSFSFRPWLASPTMTGSSWRWTSRSPGSASSWRISDQSAAAAAVWVIPTVARRRPWLVGTWGVSVTIDWRNYFCISSRFRLNSCWFCVILYLYICLQCYSKHLFVFQKCCRWNIENVGH